MAEHTPDAVDLHVGMRMRMRRRMLGVSQTALGEALGLTFQQVQKYERASNRISASKLYRVAQELRTPVAWFFEGLPDPEEESAGPAALAAARLLAEPGGAELVEAFLALPAPLRRPLVELVRGVVRGTAASDG